MVNPPSAGQLLEAVSAFLRDEALPALQGAAAYKARVAASMLDIVRRELVLAPDARVREEQALRELLGERSGTTDALTRTLCERIANDAIDLDTPGVATFLWQITLDKLAVDQPGYDTYRAALARNDTE
ncbi:hypothetical protein G3N59_15310 [Paraburkholderia sp. Ac-20340]|uniref:DUF6285 domain-containing protein n=1 Tax=Paraburkholderia sp. Ac-20340 TaxID=2703888 RepID=UPI0019800FB7|nr:DUF6285 domain-containing protein [Paraburkholderia sp. Ac-20340]MBN3854752.1 hypothetical protein [Paraburkholderia sp. Ac-20340]